MTTLKQLLDEINIDTSDIADDSKNTKDDLDLSKVKLEDIPEKERPIFKKALDIIENQTNEISKRDLMLEALKGVVKQPEKQTKQENKTDDEKILGVLDKTDPYAPAFLKLAQAIEGIGSRLKSTDEKDFKTRVEEFAKEHKDIVRYAKEMDGLLTQHPTLQNDIPKLYNLAKMTKERRDELGDNKKDRTGQFEKSGTSSTQTNEITNASSIGAAFDAAEKTLNSSRR